LHEAECDDDDEKKQVKKRPWTNVTVCSTGCPPRSPTFGLCTNCLFIIFVVKVKVA